jgi:hypothetical protein
VLKFGVPDNDCWLSFEFALRGNSKHTAVDERRKDRAFGWVLSIFTA